MYWPAFEFRYSLDLQRLLPHIMAVEAHQRAATTRILPPQWRERTPDPAVPGEAQLSEFQLKSRNIGEIQGWVRERFAPGNSPLSLEDILTVHRMVARDSNTAGQTPGTLRTDPVQVGRPEVGGFHMGAPVERLPSYMRSYIDLINSRESLRLPPIVHALLAHYFFTTLHPFIDGNGRTSRLVATAILCQRGYNVHGGYYALSDYFYQNGGIYYHTLLHRSWQQGVPFDVTPFVAFGIEGLVMELKSISSFLRLKLSRAEMTDAISADRTARDPSAVRSRERRL